MERKAYPGDLTDEQWDILKPYIPKIQPGGRPSQYERREIVNGFMYVLRTVCGWEYLPHDLPPWKTVYDYFREWRRSEVWEPRNAALSILSRRAAGGETHPCDFIQDVSS